MLQAESLHKTLIALIKLDVGLKLLRHEDVKEIMDGLPGQTLDRLQGQQVVKQECLGVSQAGHDAPLGLLPGLARILHGEGAQELHHHLTRLLAPPGGQEHLVQEPVQLLELLRGQGGLTGPEHLPGARHVREHGVQLSRLTRQAHQVVVDVISQDAVGSKRLK